MLNNIECCCPFLAVGWHDACVRRKNSLRLKMKWNRLSDTGEQNANRFPNCFYYTIQKPELSYVDKKKTESIQDQIRMQLKFHWYWKHNSHFRWTRNARPSAAKAFEINWLLIKLLSNHNRIAFIKNLHNRSVGWHCISTFFLTHTSSMTNRVEEKTQNKATT